jgi:sugar phosphate isomerase/epimerase
MKLGAYTACLHDKTLEEALTILSELGLTSIEVNAGGFLPAPHVPVDALLASDAAVREYLHRFDETGIELTALNVNGNPLHPDIEVSSKHARDLRNAIELAGRLGVRNVITMSGNPGAHPGAQSPSWVVVPWDSAYTEVLEYQWNAIAVPFWRDIEDRARDAGVRVCIEMHPHNLVYNPATLVRLIDSTGAEHVGAELDPSHLFWQGIEPLVAIDYLGDRVFCTAAKDTRINDEHCRLYGVLDNRHRPPGPGEPVIGLGGRYVLNMWPENPSWQFVAVGRGHDVDYWAAFLRKLQEIDPNMVVNIEHEDSELGQIEGLRLAAQNLRSAAARLVT